MSKAQEEGNEELKTIRLDGKITLLAPLSHIRESLGVNSYLSSDIIIGGRSAGKVLPL